MSQLNSLISDSGDFEFDGINSKNVLNDAELEIVELDNEGKTTDFGIERDITIEQDGEFLSYNGFTEKPKDFDISISKVKKIITPKRFYNRNLVINSIFKNGLDNWQYSNVNNGNLSLDTSIKYNGHNSCRIESLNKTSPVWFGNMGYLTKTKLKKGDKLFVSCMYYCEDTSIFDGKFTLELKGFKKDGSKFAFKDIYVDKTNIKQKTWTYLSGNVSITEDIDNPFIFTWIEKNGAINVTDFMVSETDSTQCNWTEAPEDISDSEKSKYFNIQYIAQQYTRSDLIKISRWIYKDSFKPLIKDGYTMYIMAEKGSMTLYENDKGIIKITVKAIPYKYKYKEITRHVTSNTDITLQNLSELLYKDFVIDFEVTMNQGTEFTLINDTNKSKFTINKMKDNEHFKVYGEQHFVESLVNNKRNLYSISSKTFPKLEYGDNVIKVSAAEADVTIYYTEIYSIQ